MNLFKHVTAALSAVALLLWYAPTVADTSQDEEIVVTAAKDERNALDVFGNTTKIPDERIKVTNFQHANQLFVEAAGTWVSRGSGQEHLTAIRSPVLTGAGACGAFLMLEDGIPIRPTGFCNVNQLFEIPTELAQSVEVLRGPANALYGSNGLHGTINVLMPAPGVRPGWNASVEAGPDEYWRGKLGWDGALGQSEVTAGVLADHYDGFRDDSGYTQQKGFFRLDRELTSGQLRVGFTATNLNQETAGFVLGEDAYKDADLRTTNPNPEAYRDADSQRLSVSWTPSEQHPWTGSELRAYVRRSDMEFLQHFLPGQPLEENGQISGGLMASIIRPWHSSLLTLGLDLEIADGFLEEFQKNPVDSDSAFLVETRPQGQHYDYDVSSLMAAPYGQIEIPLADDWQLQLGLRFEYLRYDYENNMLDGNTRDDGTECGFGGCLYNRPADRTDNFSNLAPNLGFLYRINPSTAAYLTFSRGFRAPQATELYRLQSGQDVADLDTETIDSVELGFRWQTPTVQLEAATFAMHKSDFIFRDADGFNISDGKSDHIGIEFQANARTDAGIYGSFVGTYAKHTYDFDRDAARGEVIQSGNDVDTAPRSIASARIGYERPLGLAELEWIYIDSYYLDAANTAEYEGHDILNLRGVWRITDDWATALRINNLTDKYYADRADFAFGNYRYFPARDREIFLEIAYRTL